MSHEHMSIFKHYWQHSLVPASETKFVSHSPLLQSEENLEAGKSAGTLLQRLTPKPTLNYIVNLNETSKGRRAKNNVCLYPIGIQL